MILYLFPYFPIQLYQICPLSKQCQNCPAEQLHSAVSIMLNLTVVSFDTIFYIILCAVDLTVSFTYSNTTINTASNTVNTSFNIQIFLSEFHTNASQVRQNYSSSAEPDSQYSSCSHFNLLLFSIPQVTMVA